MTNAVVTRFNTTTRAANEAEGLDEREVVRFFNKRVLVGEFDIEDISRDGWEESLPAFIANTKGGDPRKTPVALADVLDFLGEEASDEEDEEADGGSIVPTKYRILYGAAQNCGDEMARELTGYVTLERASKANPDGGLDLPKLREVAAANGIADKLAKWEDRGLNGGLLRMNTSNVLRGMLRRGEQVVVGKRTWAANPALAEARAAKKSRAKKSTKA